MNTFTAILRGCPVGLVNASGTGVIGKEWRIEATNEQFAKSVHLPCKGDSCEGMHVRCEGSETRKSAFYTKTMVKRIIHYMRQGLSEETRKILNGSRSLPISDFECVERRVKLGKYSEGKCNCQLFRDQGLVQMCLNGRSRGSVPRRDS